MTNATAIHEVVRSKDAIYRGWIRSPSFDLAFLIFPGIVGTAIGLAVIFHPLGLFIAVAATFLLGVPHYLSTFTFYLGDDNRAYYLTRPLAFVGVPLAIVAAVIGLRALHFDTPVILTMFVWNIWHVALQSAGILGIYRRLNGGPDQERLPAKSALVTTAAAMAFWQPTTFPPLSQLLDGIHAGLYRSLSLALVTVAVMTTGWLVYRICRRARRASFAELSFLAASIALFHPYLWMRDGAQATLAMLCGHFIQYLAIVWLLHARRYATGRHGSVAQVILMRISSSSVSVLAWIVGSATFVWILSRFAAVFGVPMAYIVALNALSLVHFHLDGQIWAFKQPFVRRTIAPILAPENRRVVS